MLKMISRPAITGHQEYARNRWASRLGLREEFGDHLWFFPPIRLPANSASPLLLLCDKSFSGVLLLTETKDASVSEFYGICKLLILRWLCIPVLHHTGKLFLFKSLRIFLTTRGVPQLFPIWNAIAYSTKEISTFSAAV